MPRPLISLLGVLLAAVLVAPAAASPPDESAAPAVPDAAAPAYSPDGVIVRWAPASSRGERTDAREGADVESQANLGRSFQLVKVALDQTPAGAVAALEADPAVLAAGRDGYDSLEGTPNDPLFNQLWGLSNTGLGINGVTGAIAGDDIDAIPAWDRTVGSPSIVLADLDSGYRFNNPDLGAVAWTNAGEIPGNGIDDDGNLYVDDVHGWDFVGANGEAIAPDNDPTDDDLISGGHGVHTAGTLGAAGNNGFGITGVSRNIRIMPLRICTRFPSLEGSRCPFSAEIAAINYAGKMGARAANMSFGGTTNESLVTKALGANPNTLYVISAGNDSQNNDTQPHYPCNLNPATESGEPGAIDNVICVAATDQKDGLASFSDYGAVSVDLGAPGTETLSTYPIQETPLSDSFETNDFGAKWTTAGGGFARSNEAPLTSFGITDTPGVKPAESTVYEAKQTTATAIPAGTGGCTIHGMRYRKGGSFSYGLFVDGTEKPFVSGETPGSALLPFSTVPITGLGGHSVKFFFRYTSDSTPTAEEGVWLDDVRLSCYGPLEGEPGFEFLQGTSMAAPHVTGAAGLLFSLKPTATVTEVKSALLGSVDPIPSLSGKTVTGGRLNVASALNQLVPVGTETVAPNTQILSKAEVATATGANVSFAFLRTDADAGAFECKLDGAAFATCTSPKSYPLAPGPHEFQVRAKVPSGIVDPTPATLSWTVPVPPKQEPESELKNPGTEVMPPSTPSTPGSPPIGCKVPPLAGKTLSRAKAALAAAKCTLGKVTKPKLKKGKRTRPLVVKSSTPAAGASSATGKVDLKLGPKPKSKKSGR